MYKFFFDTSHYYYFHLPIGPFHCAKFKKILTADPESWQCTIFGPKMIHKSQFFFLENYYYHSHLPISPFHCAKFQKNFFQQIQSYEDVQSLGPKWPISLNEKFFRKSVHEPCFFYSCLSTCQKPNSDINLLAKYWWLKNTGISLTDSHFCL